MLTDYYQKRLKNIIKIILLPSIAVGLIFVSHMVFAQEQSGVEISEVTVTGNKRVETELIDLNIKTKAGDIYNIEKLKADLKSVYKLGYFENVYLETEKDGDRVHVFFVLDEKPVIVDLRLSGNDKVKDKDLDTVLTIREGEIIDLKKVDNSLDGLRNLYSQKGFVGTKIDYEIEPEGDGTVTLTYNISEGKTAYIKKVTFIGNDHVEAKEIKSRIYSRPKTRLSFITKKGLYNIDEIERDRERIRGVYLDNGYLDAKVSSPEIQYLEDKKGYGVTFKIEEGPQYTLETVSFEGDFVEQPETLENVLQLKPGDIFSSSKLAGDIERLTTFFGDQGFAFANVAPFFALNKEELLVQINYKIERGNEVYVRFIDISGNIHTRDQVIRREIYQQEQSLYNATNIEAIRPRVTRLGFFDNNVEVNQDRVEGTDDLLDVLVKVKEKPTGFFSVAGGFSSVETFIFAGQVQESNLFGYGKRLTLDAQIGGVTQTISLNYSDPNFRGSTYTFDVIAFFNDREFRDFNRKSYGGTIGFGKRLYKDLGSRIAYRFENLDISNVDRDARLIITEGDRTISSFAFSLIWDTRNNLLDPTAGNITRSTIEYAGPFGGDTDFIKYTFSSRYWQPLLFGTFVTVRGLYGIIDLKNTGDDLVVGERFFLGGPNSLRGFAFRRVGPRVPTEDGDFVIIGGVQQLLVSVDYVFPIIPSAGLRGVLFYDMGNAFNDGEKFTVNPADLRNDFGAGVRWLSPLGPLRLEVGIPIGDRLPDEDSFEVQFTIGSLF